MHPTTLGRKVNKLLTTNFEEVTSKELTAKMEENLDDISHGQKEYEEVLNEFWKVFKVQVESKIPELTETRDEYRSTQTEVVDPKFGDQMILKVGRFGEYYQNPNHPEIMYPKNFREIEVAEKEAKEKFGDQTKDQKCADCGKDLIVRISKASLNPYIACPEYRVGNKHTVMPITYGDCPKCKAESRNGKLVTKSSRGRKFLSCSLDKKVCGYTEAIKVKAQVEA
jgi:DNA topoisomerase-1